MLTPITTLKKGDIITTEGFMRKVFEVLGDLVFVSNSKEPDDYWDTTMVFTYHIEELKRLGYQLEVEEWEPEVGKFYWFMDSSGYVLAIEWRNDKTDLFRLKSNNCFPTREACKARYDEIMGS